MSHDFEQRTADYLVWLKQNGIRISHKIEIADLRTEGRGRAIVATEDILNDEILFSIPRHSTLNIKNVITARFPCKAREALPIETLEEFPAWLALTAIIMFEYGYKNSSLQPYLCVLPGDLNSLVFWSQEELLDLQASAVLSKIGKSSAEMQYHEYIEPLKIPGASSTLFHAVASIIMAYAFDIPDDDAEEDTNSDNDFVDDQEEKTILTMIPLADTLNANAEENNARLVCDSEDLEMRAIKCIRAGDEIFNDYGQLPRSDLLRRYGYIASGYTPYDVVELQISLLCSIFCEDDLYAHNGKCLKRLPVAALEARLELARREDIYEEAYVIGHATEDGPCLPEELLALVHVLLIDEETLSSLQKSAIDLPSRKGLATAEVGNVLRQILVKREKQYATTLEEDEALLRSEGMIPNRKRMAIEVRLGEKRILREAMQETASFLAESEHMRIHSGNKRTIAPLQATERKKQRLKR